MTSRSDLTRTALLAASLGLVGCGLERPPDPPPFDCAQIDRAEERFPDLCGPDAGPVDAGLDDVTVTDDAGVIDDGGRATEDAP
ncbi:MAG: hypothetical protein K1X94_03460 [Sandaracinaceae bacterium]|nr:hypothetical protein [Sandaracinaceae bacterium]